MNKDQSRLRELATKQQEASLTTEEQAELNRLKAEGSVEDAFATTDPKLQAEKEQGEKPHA